MKTFQAVIDLGWYTNPFRQRTENIDLVLRRQLHQLRHVGWCRRRVEILAHLEDKSFETGRGAENQHPGRRRADNFEPVWDLAWPEHISSRSGLAPSSIEDE